MTHLRNSHGTVVMKIEPDKNTGEGVYAVVEVEKKTLTKISAIVRFFV